MIKKCNTGTIIAAVFKPFQPFYNYRVSLSFSCVSNNSAH